MEQLSKLGPFAAVIKLWNELTSAQRAVLVAFVALATTVAVITTMVASKPKMSVLFAGLAPEDAGAITQKLNDDKVPYEILPDGTIQVPSDKVAEQKMKLAVQGLPQGGSTGFELFDKNSFGMTEFTEQMNYRRALQGELTRTICQLAPVMDARVLIAIPQDKVYSSEQEPTTASIMLKLRRGMPLNDDQVGGIVHLVSSSVEGLKPANVSVVDSEGNTLSDGVDGSGHLSASQTKLKRQYESELAQNLQSMMNRIVGHEKAVVRVNADLNFDQEQSKSETYEPASATGGNAKGVALTQESTTETYNGSVIPPSAIPNNNNKITAAGDTYNRTESNSQYQVSKRITETVSAPGKVQRLSVAVLVDGSDKSITTQKIATIRQAVIAAAGIDTNKNDTVTVEKIAFDSSSKKAMEAELASENRSALIASIAKNGGAALLLIIFLVFLRIIVKQIKVQAPIHPVVKHVHDSELNPMQELSNMIDPSSSPGHPNMNQQVARGDAMNMPGADLPVELTESKPEDLAKLVRSWMSEQ